MKRSEPQQPALWKTGMGHCLPNEDKKERDMKAIWNDHILAESDDTIVVEGNHYFPADSIETDLFRDSDTTSKCPWKGTASYKSLEVSGKTNVDAVWYYPDPKDAAKEIKGRFAFWNGVEVTA